jgi:hypothetical protein
VRRDIRREKGGYPPSATNRYNFTVAPGAHRNIPSFQAFVIAAEDSFDRRKDASAHESWPCPYRRSIKGTDAWAAGHILDPEPGVCLAALLFPEYRPGKSVKADKFTRRLGDIPEKSRWAAGLAGSWVAWRARIGAVTGTGLVFAQRPDK